MGPEKTFCFESNYSFEVCLKTNALHNLLVKVVQIWMQFNCILYAFVPLSVTVDI